MQQNYELIRFTAEWCGPCRQYAPIFEQFVEENDVNARVVDVDKQPELAKAMGITSLPTTVLMDTETKEVVNTIYGAYPLTQLRVEFSELCE